MQKRKRKKCTLIAWSINEFTFIAGDENQQFKSSTFLHTLSRLVSSSFVSRWQAGGAGGVSVLSKSNTSLSGDISTSDFVFLGTLWGEKKKTKTLHNLLNSLRSLTCASWINQNRETRSLDTMSYHLSQDKTYTVTRIDKALKTHIQYFFGNRKKISEKHKKVSVYANCINSPFISRLSRKKGCF